MASIIIYCDQDQQTALLLGLEHGIIRTDDPDKADVFLGPLDWAKNIAPRDLQDKILIYPDLWHGEENGSRQYQKMGLDFLSHFNRGGFLILSQYQFWPKIDFMSSRIQVKSYDLMFNRNKAYFSQFPFKNLFYNYDIPWYWAGSRCYDIDQWSRASELRSKIFLSSNRPWVERPWSIRPDLNQLLDSYADMGYLARYDPNADVSNFDIKLHSRKEDPLVNGALEFDIHQNKIIDHTAYYIPIGDMTRGFSPVHMNYYENSFVSIYGESVEFGDTIFVTEKTFNPLIQGHFILPFGAQHIVKTIKNMGFKVPEFIDYSYDEIQDYEKRKDAFFQEIQRVLAYSVRWWADQRDKNLDLLFHNRRLFWLKPFDQFTPHIKEMLQQI